MSSSATNDIINQIKKIDKKYASFIILASAVALLIALVLYWIYLAILKNRECTFMTDTYGDMNKYIRSLNSSDTNCGYNVRDYYIKTAYNCCSGGYYKNDYVSTCALKNILKQGVRGLDMEVYSIDNEPCVATSIVDNFNIKQTFNSVKFDDVMKTLKNNAFTSSGAPNYKDPIFLHLRIKSKNNEMYKRMVHIFESYNEYMLPKKYSFENQNANFTLTPILELKGKIVLIVNRNDSTDTFLSNKEFMEYINLTSDSMFMRMMDYNTLKDYPNIVELQTFNKRHVSLVTPNLYETNPSNPDPYVAKGAGCQMVAMRYEYVDDNLLADVATFDKCGYAFCLKPEALRYMPVEVPDPTPQDPALSYGVRNYKSDYYNFDV